MKRAATAVVETVAAADEHSSGSDDARNNAAGDELFAAHTYGAPTPPRRRGKRRATYHVRRDEIITLQRRMSELENELRALKYQALIGETCATSSNSSAGRTTLSESTASMAQAAAAAAPTHSCRSFNTNSDDSRPLAKSSLAHRVLLDAVQTQQSALTGLQALASKYSCLQTVNPVHTPIRLGTDAAQRHATLVAARELALQRSRRFIAERSAALDLDRIFSEQERCETRTHDYVAIGFDIVPLAAGSSARRVFDALFFQIRNIEITFSEVMGHIAVRENDDTGDAWLSQHRLVVSIADAALVETNVVVFADFESAGDGDDSDSDSSSSGFGIIVLDWIDDDALFPYRPAERVRRDTACIFTVQTHTRPVDAKGEDSAPCVVVLRWSQTRLRKPQCCEFDVRVTQEMRASIGTWGDRMLQTMYEHAYSRPVATSAAACAPDAVLL